MAARAPTALERLISASGVRPRPGTATTLREELEEAAVVRLRGFSWLLLAVHLPLLAHDLWTAPASAGSPERAWQGHLLELHVAMLVATGAALALFRILSSRSKKALVAYAMTVFILVWGGALSGVDQLIGAGITIYLIVNLGSSLFVTFERNRTFVAFALGLAAFIAGQIVFAGSAALAFSQGVNGAGFALTCVIFSRMLYGVKARDYSQRRTIDEQHAELVTTNARLEQERAKTEQLLRSALPPRIVERLQRGETPIADAHSGLVILWADLCRFTQLASSLPPAELVVLLDELFSRFDAVVQREGLEKIKTVGDGYLAVAGIAKPGRADAVAAANAAHGMHEAVAEIAARAGRSLSLRIGIARGEAMAGVLGRDRLLYDLWGDAVNVASRLESAALPGQSLVTAEIAAELSETHELGASVALDVKGKGTLIVQPVGSRKAAGAPAKAPSLAS
ncbi:MAG TPA: adenylate/guanylate cyclase domain-containing protein [Polyangiaceae bacterium]|nr:adenylate/guanylate cyclase domain-containing protein [Polyangiaceae bacterium]